MAVYVDRPAYPFGRMTMCHMLADTTKELLAMAVAIGMKAAWIQKAGQPDEHFDVCKSKRALAVGLGAVEVDGRDLVRVIRGKRQQAGGGR